MLDVFPAEIREVEEIEVKDEATKGQKDMDIRQMMKQAQKVQEQLARQAEELRVEGNAGGGMVTVVPTGPSRCCRCGSIPRSSRKTTSRCCRT